MQAPMIDRLLDKTFCLHASTLFSVSRLFIRKQTFFISPPSLACVNLPRIPHESVYILYLKGVSPMLHPGITCSYTGPGELLLFTFKIEVSIVLQINMIKLSVNKTKWTSLSPRIRAFRFWFEYSIKFRHWKVIGTFEKRTGHRSTTQISFWYCAQLSFLGAIVAGFAVVFDRSFHSLSLPILPLQSNQVKRSRR